MLLAALIAAAAVATTGGADSVTTSSATLTGTVNPGGVSTTYHFEYGTSSGYGLSTPDTDAGSGTGALSVSAGITRADGRHDLPLPDRRVQHGRPLPGRRPHVPHHRQRQAAIGQRGRGDGRDCGRRDAAREREPEPARHDRPLRVRDLDRLRHGNAEQSAGGGSSSTTASAAVGGLKPHTTYHYRAVATNAAGVTRGGDRTFTTSRTPTSVAVTLSTTRPAWGGGLTITGTVAGQGSIPVALERQDFPFATGFYQAAQVTASSSGKFTINVAQMFSASRMRVVTRTPIPVTSAVSQVEVSVKAGLRAKRVSGRRVRLTGSVWPGVPHGRISLQRQTKTGGWLLVKHVTPHALSGNRSSYQVTVTRHSRALSYRVVVVAHNGGANVPGTSRTVTVPKR